jgi:hypothetical protein
LSEAGAAVLSRAQWNRDAAKSGTRIRAEDDVSIEQILSFDFAQNSRIAEER